LLSDYSFSLPSSDIHTLSTRYCDGFAVRCSRIQRLQRTKNNRVLWVWIFGVLAALYNPIFPVHLDRSTWIGANWFTVGVIAIAGVVFRARHDVSRAGSSDPPPRTPYEQPPSKTPHPPKRSRHFQITIWAFVVVAVLVGVAAFAIYLAGQAALSREIEASKHRISSSEIQLVDLDLRHQNQAKWDSCMLIGRVRNHSLRHTLRRVSLKITLRDKLPSGESEIIGEEDAYINVTVPPGQTRELSTYVYFAHLPAPRGQFSWSYVITELEAK